VPKQFESAKSNLLRVELEEKKRKTHPVDFMKSIHIQLSNEARELPATEKGKKKRHQQSERVRKESTRKNVFSA
jgi:hypothetical protein